MLSGIVDMGVGLLFVIGVISAKDSPVPLYIVCFATGAVYFALGLLIAILSKKKQGK